MQRRRPITLDSLLRANRTLFQVCPGDEATPANITVAEAKEMMVAIHVSNERIQSLYQDVQKAEERIETLERRLHRLEEDEEDPYSLAVIFDHLMGHPLVTQFYIARARVEHFIFRFVGKKCAWCEALKKDEE